MSYFDIEIAHDQMKILFDFQKPDGQIADVVYINGKTVFGSPSRLFSLGLS